MSWLGNTRVMQLRLKVVGSQLRGTLVGISTPRGHEATECQANDTTSHVTRRKEPTVTSRYCLLIPATTTPETINVHDKLWTKQMSRLWWIAKRVFRG